MAQLHYGNEDRQKGIFFGRENKEKLSTNKIGEFPLCPSKKFNHIPS